MAGITVFTNAFLIDCTGKEPIDGAAVVVDGERIVDVISSGRVGPLPGRVETLDLGGRTLMPGLTDAHVHVYAADGNTAEQHRQHPPSLLVAKALRRMEQALMQGFTTVRDAGGADYGLREAAASGLYPGPRMLVSGRALSQTGGHGDKRRRAEWTAPVECCLGMVGVIADGPDEVRRAVREQLRHDVDQIKVMASGGAMSPGDELDTTQYTVEEMRAAVEEARAVGTYVLAHAYSPSAVRNALQAGVRCIEHGNLIDERVARDIVKAGAYLVPTMVTYEAIWREGKSYGISEHQLQKINMAREKSVEGLAHAYRAGCKIGSGSDLLGDMQAQRLVELELKGQVMKPMDVLLSATRVNAEIFRREKDIGSVEPGKVRRPHRGEGQSPPRSHALSEPEQPRADHEGRRGLQADLLTGRPADPIEPRRAPWHDGRPAGMARAALSLTSSRYPSPCRRPCPSSCRSCPRPWRPASWDRRRGPPCPPVLWALSAAFFSVVLALSVALSVTLSVLSFAFSPALSICSTAFSAGLATGAGVWAWVMPATPARNVTAITAAAIRRILVLLL